ncbi:LPS-assembly protein LptD [Ahrensia sp. R2A130]|uniref:LPS-assembly protein LptD n=1 Tax=Ahrensia sp. R2A130 TaxID=744979 RepID=UPI0001E09431|nr:LPS-assembly protein LptD [Ahrensia sp. R2A130]EFL90594.1 organic solvent tolerance protein [Ahrensia sp. R2A130]
MNAAPSHRHVRAPLAAQRRIASAARLLLLSTALVAAPALQGIGTTSSALAQSLEQRDPNAQLLLKADELIYDNDNEIVTARGNVQMDYDGYNVVADRVSYNQQTRRVKAFGNVEILEPDGNRIFADEIDLTDDFGEGFVNALRVETPDNTRFAAESAERFAGQKTVFNHGVYTACEPCKERPDKAPIWQIKAEKVILDGVEKTVTYRNARFELFGAPIAFLPYFQHADPSIKRKSGFLIPRVGYSSDRGAYYEQSYFLVTGPSHDLTATGTYYNQQGFLGQAEWRHQLENGFYNIRIAGISQENKGRFEFAPDNSERERGLIASNGRFDINPNWAFGWNLLAQSDSNFARTYDISGLSDQNVTNQIYLTGLAKRSYFNLSAKQYLVQNETIVGTGNAFSFESQQPTVLPVLDYNTVRDDEFLGGEFKLDVNVAAIKRNQLDATIKASGDNRVNGINGETLRASVDLSWQKSIETSFGFVVTPIASVRGDFMEATGQASSASLATNSSFDRGDASRFLPTAGIEVRYPLLVTTETSSHVFEPIAQVFLRPELGYTGARPNEDAQSLVFDANNLFNRDKFSGYDRIEDGSRANIGLRYSGIFDNGVTLNGLVGQSFVIGDHNPFAREDDLTNTGEESGLESDTSDYVAALSLGGSSGWSLGVQGRFDEDSIDLRRGEVEASYGNAWGSAFASYAFIAAQPDYAFPDDRSQIAAGTTINFTENWSASAQVTYDLQDHALISDTLLLSYIDECLTFSIAFTEAHSTLDDSDPDRTVSFKISLRTLGDFQQTVSDNTLDRLANE